MFDANHSGPLVFANARLFRGVTMHTLVKLKGSVRPFLIPMDMFNGSCEGKVQIILTN